MSTAAETRQAVRAHPFLLEALRAGVLNYRAAARFLAIDDVDAGAAALRRLGEELSPFESVQPELRVRMESGIGPVESDEEAMLSLSTTRLGQTDGPETAIIAEGSLDTAYVARILARIAEADIDPIAMGYSPGYLVIVVERAAGPTTVRCVEASVST